MSDSTKSFLVGFQSLCHEYQLNDLTYQGEIPIWLNGYFISNGPALFELNNKQFHHWFDGFAMLKKFRIQAGRVDFCNRFILTKQYTNSIREQRLAYNEFATHAKMNTVKKLKHWFQQLRHIPQYDNCNVNVLKLKDHFIALTETPLHYQFDSENLETLSTEMDLTGFDINSAHPIYDRLAKTTINIGIKIGRKITYCIYQIDTACNSSKVIANYISRDLFYFHSFALTENFIILFKTPYKINRYKLISPNFSFIESLYWDSNQETNFILVDRRDGSITEIPSEPFLCLHNVNAFEVNNDVIIDMVCYKEHANIYHYFYFNYLKNSDNLPPNSTIQRFEINRIKKSVTKINLFELCAEFPNINKSLACRNQYRYIYSLAIEEDKFFNQIIKYDLKLNNITIWQENHCYVGEPVFVANPNSAAEDDGVVMSIVLDTVKNYSFLLILQASTLSQIAKIPLSFYIPFGLHGHFYPLSV